MTSHTKPAHVRRMLASLELEAAIEREALAFEHVQRTACTLADQRAAFRAAVHRLIWMAEAFSRTPSLQEERR